MKGLIASLVLTVVAFVSGSAVAVDVPPNVDGELHVTLKNAEYVKVQVNGEDYENIEFEKDGKVVVIKGLSLSLDRNAIVLLPNAESALKQAELEVVPKDFKKKRKGREIYLVANKAIAFEKASTDAPPSPEPKKPDPIAPPMPDKEL